MSMVKLTRILPPQTVADMWVAQPSGSGISGMSGYSGPPVVVAPVSGTSGNSGVVAPPVSGHSGTSGTSGNSGVVPPNDMSGYSGTSGTSGVVVVPTQMDVYVNPDYVIALEPDVVPNTCNMHLTTGWYHIVGDMDSVVAKMESWFSKRAFKD